jgi:exopolyphosphatase/guanosine-5'-triphosphate,3'-diphosphate pyrophosphatase
VLNGKPAAIIDIGSNSVRLVVYEGAERMPAPVFNEKVMAGLGTGLAETGRLGAEQMGNALASLARFRLLLDHMKVKRARVVATAAVRDADNGHDFVQSVEALGFRCEILSGGEEAALAGEGVLSAIPNADGIAGDLGGGSLELVDLADGKVGDGISLPLGVLQIKPGTPGQRDAMKILEKRLKGSGLRKRAKGRPFYMVGGSWRALARIDMFATGYPLPIIHQYEMRPERLKQLQKITADPKPEWLTEVSEARLAAAPVAASLLNCIVEMLEPSKLVVSTSGIREGLLFTSLKPRVKQQDPLIEEVRCLGDGQSPFGEHGDLLDNWIGAIFDDKASAARIRLAACLLADVAWQTNPAFRADRGVEMALHGNWVGINAGERVMMAQALSSTFGRDLLADPAVARLRSSSQLRRAQQWGLAMRLGQRLCGGVASALDATDLFVSGSNLVLNVSRSQAALIAEPVRKRLRALAAAMELTPTVTTGH